MEQQESMVEPMIEVRPIRYGEFDKYTSLWRINGFICVHEYYILERYRTHIHEFIAAFCGGKMVGTCWDIPSTQGRCIGALTVDPCYPNALRAMINFVCRRYHPNTVFDANIPIFLNRSFGIPGWIRQWDVRLYMGIISRLKLIPLTNDQKYHIEQTIDNNPFFLNSVVGEIPPEIPEVRSLSPAINAVFSIYRDGDSVGYANLRKIGTNPFVIGPVIASNIEVAVILLKSMLSYIITTNQGGYVATYVLKHHEAYCYFLIESGFQLGDHQWTRCSLNKTFELSREMPYDHGRKTVFALDCIVLCIL